MDVNKQEHNTDIEKEDLGDSLIISPFDPTKIDIQPILVTIDSIVARLKYDEIDLFSDFQRKNDLWTIEKQSRLIESILISVHPQCHNSCHECTNLFEFIRAFVAFLYFGSATKWWLFCK